MRPEAHPLDQGVGLVIGELAGTFPRGIGERGEGGITPP